MARMYLNCPPWLEKILKYAGLKWLEMYLNCPPWLEKILKYAGFKWLEMYLNGKYICMYLTTETQKYQDFGQILQNIKTIS